MGHRSSGSTKSNHLATQHQRKEILAAQAIQPSQNANSMILVTKDTCSIGRTSLTEKGFL